MLGWGKTGAVRASAADRPARSQDVYQHYAALLYRQALLAPRDSAWAEHAGCDVMVNERALAAMPDRGEDDARDPQAPGQSRRRWRGGWRAHPSGR